MVLREVSSDEAAERRKDLQEICGSFCLLSLELWCQKSEVDILEDAVLLAQPFTITSQLQQPHVSMGLDDDDRRFDNVLPHAVLVPAIRIFGDSFGDNLQEYKVISRSVVLIYEDPSSDNVGTTPPDTSSGQHQAHNTRSLAADALDSTGSTKRKLSLNDPVSKKPRKLSSAALRPSSTIFSPTVVPEHTRMKKISQGEDLMIDPMEQIGRGNSPDQAQKQLKVAAQVQQNPSELVSPAQDLTSKADYGRQLSPNNHRRKRVLEDRQRKIKNSSHLTLSVS